VPIKNIGPGKIEVGYELCDRLLNSGFYTNVAAFPSVPYNRAGLRMTITQHHSLADINQLLTAIHRHLEDILEESDFSMAQIYKAFKMHKSNTERVVAGS
ncbi:MAG: hypothetical protein AAFP19_27060, partial [Bacteroidota bacterium]